ncbi:MAG: hypothetical protein HC806_10005 [Anaerolineae bacterium]|nr:hypothetical protein [Anaerolineae bacterium]
MPEEVWHHGRTLPPSPPPLSLNQTSAYTSWRGIISGNYGRTPSPISPL